MKNNEITMVKENREYWKKYKKIKKWMSKIWRIKNLAYINWIFKSIEDVINFFNTT